MNQPKLYARLRWQLAQYLEGRWWQRYLRRKDPEAYLAEKRAYWQRTLDELEWQLQSGRKVLDAGCGPAGVFILAETTERVTALDPLLKTYEQTLPIFSQSVYPRVNFRAQTLETPLTNDPKFEAIYCFNAINHVANWDLALDQLSNYATPGTSLILTSDVHRHSLLLPIFRALPGDALHPQQHDAADYREALTSRGWVIEREVELRREFIFQYTAWVCIFAPPSTNTTL